MEIVKKYWISFACAAVAVLAFIATVFWPLPGYFDSLKVDLDKRRGAYNQADQLLKKSRNLPVLVVDSANATQEKLTQFPNQQIIDNGSAVTKQMQDESLRMYDFAVQMNTHKPLISGSLPVPSQPAAFKFRDEYPRAMRAISRDILHATMPPTAQDEKRAKDDLWTKKFQPQVFGEGDDGNLKEMQKRHEEESADMMQILSASFARNHWVYADEKDVFTWNPNIAGAGAPSPVNIWTAQMLLWLQEDIAHAIAQVNEPYVKAGEPAYKEYDALTEEVKKLTAAPASGILASPIKHVLKIEVKPGYVGGTGNSAANAALPKNLTVSPTGRVSNGLFDVVHFDLTMNVEIAKIPLILQELSRSRLITVLNIELKPVDAIDAASRGFIYGSQPIGRLELRCEALFLRKWTEPLMPEAVKASLGLQQQAAPTPSEE